MAMVNPMIIGPQRQKPVPSVMNTVPHVGIELEFDSLKSNPVQWYRDKLLKNGMFHCAQVEQGTGSLELHFLTTEGLYQHETGVILDIIKEGHGFIDDRCELHIHVDCRYRNRVDVYNTLLEYQDMMFCMAADSQISNAFCVPNQKGREPWKFSAIRPSDKQETIEVRIFEPTLDADKLNFFINNVIGIVNFNNALWKDSQHKETK